MSSNFSKYQFLWEPVEITTSASYNAYVNGDHFIPCGSMTISGTSLYTQFPTQSFSRTYDQFNVHRLSIEQFSVVSYTISQSIDKPTNTIIVQFYPYTSYYPGRIDSITFGLQYELEFFLSYSLDWRTHSWSNQQPYLRSGLYINGSTGSPQLNIQTSTASAILPKYIAGDFFYSASDGYYVNFEDAARKLLTLRTNENIGRYTTIENPYNTIVDINSSVIDNFYRTIIGTASTITGSLWLNANWSGGIYMPDSNTVSIYGSNKKFIISSGNFIASQSMTASSITFAGAKTSWIINAIPTTLTQIALEFRNSNVIIPSYVSITDVTSSLLIIGDSASAQINNSFINNVVMYSGSVSLSPTTNGAIQMYSASGASGSNLGYVYVSGTWYTILTGSNSYPTLSNGLY